MVNLRQRLQKNGPFSMVIFGASGDLVARKLASALFRLTYDGILAEKDIIICGVARRDWSDDTFRDKLRAAVRDGEHKDIFSDEVWDRLASRIFYVRGDAHEQETFDRLEARLTELGEQEPGRPDRNRLYYLATLPSLYPDIIDGLGRLKLQNPDRGWTRIVIEKPFGHDLESARSLNRQLRQYFEEREIFRIDHYLGKETVQNILVLRFANGIFEPIWNRHYISHVEITVAESAGVGHRAGYYEEAGALRDMVQNHLLQLLSLIAMEPPSSFQAGAIRDEKVKVLRSIPLLTPEQVASNTVRGQYTRGEINGKSVPGYREEPNVAPDSNVETFAAIKLMIENWRWAGVPFYLRTGKRLPERSSRIAIAFRCPPHLPFQETMVPELGSNTMIIHIQPEEGITLSIGAKIPGPEIRIRNVDMEFFYDRSFTERSAEAYEYLLLEAMLGDTTMFTRDDETDAAWALISGIHEAWDAGISPLQTYPAGTWGPTAAEHLIEFPVTGCAVNMRDADDPWLRRLAACGFPKGTT